VCYNSDFDYDSEEAEQWFINKNFLKWNIDPLPWFHLDKFVVFRYLALHVLICSLLNIFWFVNKQFSKMCPSARVSGPEVGRGHGQNCSKSFLGYVGMCEQNFIKFFAGVRISIILYIFSITSLFTLDFVHRCCGYNFLKENNIDVAFSSWLTNKRGFLVI